MNVNVVFHENLLVLVLVLVFAHAQSTRRVSNPGRRIPRLLRPERLWCGCSYRRLFLAARAIMVSGVLRRGARDPHAREWSGSCSRYRRRLERGRRTSGGVMLGYRVSTSTCRLLAPLLYAGLDALVTYFLRHFRPSQFCIEPISSASCGASLLLPPAVPGRTRAPLWCPEF